MTILMKTQTTSQVAIGDNISLIESFSKSLLMHLSEIPNEVTQTVQFPNKSLDQNKMY